MKYFDKLYVRAKGNVPFDTSTNPLAFATPYEDNAAGRKRQETVDSWARPHLEYDYEKKQYKPAQPELPPYIIDNVPLEGFKLIDVASRYSTSNKMFRVIDPRGFTLEIDTYNLLDILENGVVDHGIIKGKMVWLRNSGNYLEFYDKFAENISKESEKTTSGIQIGDLVEVGSRKMEYLGKAYGILFSVNQTGGDEDKTRYTYSNTYKYYLNYDIKINSEFNDKGYYIFYDTESKYFYSYKSMPKYSIIKKDVRTHHISEVETLGVDNYHWNNDKGRMHFAVSNYGIRMSKFFVKKEDAKAFNDSLDENSLVDMCRGIKNTTISSHMKYVSRDVYLNNKKINKDKFFSVLLD